MKIQDIKLSKFRSYDNLKLSFAPNVNILYGKNGVGKTNLVESIYVLALTKSFRTNNDKNLLMKDCEETSVEGTILTNVSTKYRIILGNDGK
jgi:DNA replication and repair protein RecF